MRMPDSYRLHPLGTTLMALWGIFGFSLFLAPFGQNMWPGILIPENVAEAAAYWTEAALMSSASVLYLLGHGLLGVWRHAPFTRWLGLWAAALSCLHILAGIVILLAQDRAIYPQWIAAGVFWSVALWGFVAALALAHRQEFPKRWVIRE